MFDLINGLPVHPLVVHAVVVLLPLAALGTIALAVRPAWRRPYGVARGRVRRRRDHPHPRSRRRAARRWRSTSATRECTPSSATSSSGSPSRSSSCSAALVWLDRRRTADGTTSSRRATSPGLLRTVAALALVAGLAATVQVYRVGDSGARAAWGDQVSSSSS